MGRITELNSICVMKQIQKSFSIVNYPKLEISLLLPSVQYGQRRSFTLLFQTAEQNKYFIRIMAVDYSVKAWAGSIVTHLDEFRVTTQHKKLRHACSHFRMCSILILNDATIGRL